MPSRPLFEQTLTDRWRLLGAEDPLSQVVDANLLRAVKDNDRQAAASSHVANLSQVGSNFDVRIGIPERGVAQVGVRLGADYDHPAVRRSVPVVRGVPVAAASGGAGGTAANGFQTTAFDTSETAIRTARERYPNSPVSYCSADLLSVPSAWLRAFDLVVEIINIQALPLILRPQAVAAVASLVAAGGTFLAVENVRQDSDPMPDRPP